MNINHNVFSNIKKNLLLCTHEEIACILVKGKWKLATKVEMFTKEMEIWFLSGIFCFHDKIWTFTWFVMPIGQTRKFLNLLLGGKLSQNKQETKIFKSHQIADCIISDATAWISNIMVLLSNHIRKFRKSPACTRTINFDI